MRRSTLPLSPEQRARLEPAVYRRPRPILRQLFSGLGLWFGGGLPVSVGVTALRSLHYFTLLPNILLIVVAFIAIIIGTPLVVAAIWQWANIWPRHPVLVRPRRDLSSAAAELIAVDVVRAWNIKGGDEDAPDPVLIQQSDGSFVMLNFPALDDLFDNRGLIVRERLRITRFDDHVIAIESTGAEVQPTPITDAQALIDVYDMESEVELPIERLPASLASVVGRPQ